MQGIDQGPWRRRSHYPGDHRRIERHPGHADERQGHQADSRLFSAASEQGETQGQHGQANALDLQGVTIGQAAYQ